MEELTLNGDIKANIDSIVDSDNESNPDSITLSLERVGVNIPSFMIPTIDISKKINDYFIQSVNMEKSSSSNIKEILSGLINKRTSDLKNLYSEVSQSLTGIVNSNIDHPIEDYIEEIKITDNLENNVDNELDESNGNNNNNNNNNDDDDLKVIKKYEYLTFLTFEQFQDQFFLRRRIREILNLHIKPHLQRILIQKLMSRSYIEKQKHIKLQSSTNYNKNDEINKDPNNNYHYNINYQEIDISDESDNDEIEEDEVILLPKDLEPTYYNIDENILGCEHYQRNCKAECPICHKWYTCRFCHDNVNSSHQFDRKKVKHILCMFCFTPQHPGQYCIQCNKELSKYYCSKCNLFDNDPLKNIYHCDKCGICRLGLGLNQDYFHCDSCNACISIDLQKNHVCIENSTKSNCPICDEFMFNSNEKVVFMNCGHPIHEKCYEQHTIHSYKCPTCSKTIVNMELQFRMRDSEIKQSQMPDELKNWVSEIKCIDCGGMSRVPFHYLGHKCDHCYSYNTMQIKLIKGDDDEPNKPVDLNLDNTDEKLYISEQFINNSLKQNFEFAEVKENLKGESKNNTENNNSNNNSNNENNNNTSQFNQSYLTDEDHSIDHDYVDNFIRVINNFEAYSSISDAFKDWINTSLNHNISDDNDDDDKKF